ncbi:hypothetical protein EDC96DRAFT_542376 [Choanephora cucurbitarum]|nr:hypothetical protein EDC96DRAFT_542376 [Choanephora cucurbitarum]
MPTSANKETKGLNQKYDFNGLSVFSRITLRPLSLSTQNLSTDTPNRFCPLYLSSHDSNNPYSPNFFVHSIFKIARTEYSSQKDLRDGNCQLGKEHNIIKSIKSFTSTSTNDICKHDGEERVRSDRAESTILEEVRNPLVMFSSISNTTLSGQKSWGITFGIFKDLVKMSFLSLISCCIEAPYDVIYCELAHVLISSWSVYQA